MDEFVDDIDDILVAASQDFEERTGVCKEKKETSRFAQPFTEETILKKIAGAIPTSTKRSTTWAVRVWDSWIENRASCSDNIELPVCLDIITNEQLNMWLARFVMEVRNQNGDPYIGGTLYGLCAGIQRYVREKRVGKHDAASLDIYKDPNFSFFRGALDSVLKELHQDGIGNEKKQAEIISCDLEAKLWSDGILGDDNPQKLLDTLVYIFGLNLALRSGKEHRNLKPDMIQLYESDSGMSYLLYSEHGSKNHSGGLKERKVANKSVKVFANIEEPQKCPVRLYSKYMSLRPYSARKDVFYLQPLQNPVADCWYQSKPVGHNTLTQTVKRLCAKVGVEGHYTNHSLRRTCATRLYQQGADDDQIMSVTGHRTLNGLKVYKRISLKQEERLSEMIRATKKPKIEVKDDPPKLTGFEENSMEKPNIEVKPVRDSPKCIELQKENVAPVAFNFSDCAVTVNYH